MLVQLANIIGGALLSSTFIKNQLKSGPMDTLFAKAAPYEAGIGIFVFILGITALVERVGIFWFGITGASFPQAIPAILIGLLLGAPILGRYGFLKGILVTIEPYRSWVGLLGIACGLGSLLFGCVLPLVCFAPFGI